MDNTRILFTNETGGVSVIVPAPGVQLEDVLKAVPHGADYEVVDVADVPSDRTFRNAWNRNGKQVGVDLDKAKGITHDKRRAKRAAEFAPLDVEATIPAKAAQAEAARQAIRDKHAAMQTEIDAAADAAALKAIIEREAL
jgi:hypothetical protein